ncbi:MAG: hypothetical protein IJF44_06460 [Clostridia bacterium]|nr:hypothetical protein [Clostridia bacterium]
MDKQRDFIFCRNLINNFVIQYLKGDIFNFLDFDFETLMQDKKYGCPNRSFDCDDTNLARAICYLLWKDVYPKLTLQDIGTGRMYRGDTLNTFNTVLGSYLPEKQTSKGILTSGATNEMHILVNQFHRTYHTIGNFILLPNIAETDNKRAYTLNTYRGIAYKDYFDIFLQKLTTYSIEKNVDLHLSTLIERNNFFFSWLFSMGGVKYLKEVCWLDDYFESDVPKKLFEPYAYCPRKKKEWSTKEKMEYTQQVEKYIFKATCIIENRCLKMVTKLKNICYE